MRLPGDGDGVAERVSVRRDSRQLDVGLDGPDARGPVKRDHCAGEQRLAAARLKARRSHDRAVNSDRDAEPLAVAGRRVAQALQF